MSLIGSALSACAGLAAGFAAAGALLYRQRRLLAAARREAHHDDLTGLPNRRALTTHLHTATGRGQPFAVAMLDIDQFKSVNDTHGHQTGDQLLQAVAERLRRLPSPVRLAARLAGDEFVLVITGERDTAIDTATAAWRAITTTPIRLHDRLVQLSVSIGVATWRPGLHGQHLLHHADRAMYAAKASGGGVHAHTAHPDDGWIPHRPAVRRRDRHRT